LGVVNQQFRFAIFCTVCRSDVAISAYLRAKDFGAGVAHGVVESQSRRGGRCMKGADKLDHTIEQTFPASDPPANTVVTGVRVGPSAEFVVRDNPEQSRLETEIAGQIATLRYERHPHAVVLVQTDVPVGLRGRGVANALAKWAIETAERDGLRVVAACPFVRAYMHRVGRNRAFDSQLTH
jgi:predicted GNAT family acetyltransferase